MLSGVVSISAIPSSSTLWLREQSRVPSLGRGYVVPRPQTVLWTPPTPGTARCDFVSLYAPVGVPQHHPIGSPALDCQSSATCRPCYPGRSPEPIPFSKPWCCGLPHMTSGSASSDQVTRLRAGSLALRPVALPFGNSRPPVARTPLPRATRVYGQFPGRDFNPLDQAVVTAYGQVYTLDKAKFIPLSRPEYAALSRVQT